MKPTIGAMLMAMSACAVAPPAEGEAEDVPVKGESGYTCDAAPAQKLVGRESSQELGAEALRLTGARTLRWIPEGGMVTMDYREDRLNIELDGSNRVKAIRCG